MPGVRRERVSALVLPGVERRTPRARSRRDPREPFRAAAAVAREQRVGREPQAREDGRANHAPIVRDHRLVDTVAEGEPADLGLVHGDDHVLQAPVPAVDVQLLVEVRRSTGSCDLGDELDAAVNVSVRIRPRDPPRLWDHPKEGVRLRFVVVVETQGGVRQELDPRSREHVETQPGMDPAIGQAVVEAHRRRHVDHPIDQLRLPVASHRGVAMLELGARETVPALERGNGRGGVRSVHRPARFWPHRNHRVRARSGRSYRTPTTPEHCRARVRRPRPVRALASRAP